MYFRILDINEGIGNNLQFSNLPQNRGRPHSDRPLPGLGPAAAPPPLLHRRADRPAGHVRLRRLLRRRLGRDRHQQLEIPRSIRIRRHYDRRFPLRRHRVLLFQVRLAGHDSVKIRTERGTGFAPRFH